MARRAARGRKASAQNETPGRPRQQAAAPRGFDFESDWVDPHYGGYTGEATARPDDRPRHPPTASARQPKAPR